MYLYECMDQNINETHGSQVQMVKKHDRHFLVLFHGDF